jgi:hypothetical protein
VAITPQMLFGLYLGELPALEQEVGRREPAVAARGHPVHGQEATRGEVEAKFD